MSENLNFGRNARPRPAYTSSTTSLYVPQAVSDKGATQSALNQFSDYIDRFIEAAEQSAQKLGLSTGTVRFSIVAGLPETRAYKERFQAIELQLFTTYPLSKHERDRWQEAITAHALLSKYHKESTLIYIYIHSSFHPN